VPISPERPPSTAEIPALSESALLGAPFVPPPRRRRRVPRVLGITVGTLILAVAGAGIGYDAASANNFLPGTRIGDVLVGGRSVDDATVLLRNELITPLRTQAITLLAPRVTQSSTAWDMGLRLRLDEAVADTLSAQQRGSLIVRVWRRVAGDERNVAMPTDVDAAQLNAFLAKAAARIDRPPRDASVQINGDTLAVVRHQIGRRLDVASAHEHLVRALRLGDRRVRLPVEVTEPQLRADQFEKVVLVRTGSNRLDLYLQGKLARSFPVATGTPGYATPHGQFTITAKRMNPSWGNPWAPWSMNMPATIPPGPNNPLGTRAMNLSVGGIRIHGTPDAHTIGRPASHGCIRMLMRDAEELFDIVDVGTPVVIMGA
jgi:hypothetical protein